MRAAAPLLFYCLLLPTYLLCTDSAHAQSPGQAAAPASAAAPVQLQFDGPPECPGAAAIEAELQQIPPGSDGPLLANVKVRKTRNGYRMVLWTQHKGRHGQRRLQAPNCRELTRSVALVLSLMLGRGPLSLQQAASADTASPSAPTPEPRSTPPTAPGANPAPVPPAPEPLPTAPPRRPTRRTAQPLSWLSSLGARFQKGTLPGYAYGIDAGLELALRPIALGVRATWLPTERNPVRNGVQIVGETFQGQLYGCGNLLRMQVLKLGACAGLQSALSRVRGSGNALPSTTTTSHHALFLESRLTWPTTGRLAVQLRSSLGYSLNRPRLQIQQPDENSNLRVHRSPRWLPAFGLAVLLRI